MRRLMVSALMILCLGLGACGSPRQQLDGFTAGLCNADGIRMTALVQADHGDTVEEYTLEYSFDGTRWTAVVTRPEVLAGITAYMGEDASELAYDGAILAAGNILAMGVSPIGAVPMMARTLQAGYLDSYWTEGDLLAGTYVYDDGVSVTVWFDTAGSPAAAELTEDGIVKARCRFEHVSIEVGNHGTTDKTDLGGDQPEQSGT